MTREEIAAVLSTGGPQAFSEMLEALHEYARTGTSDDPVIDQFWAMISYTLQAALTQLVHVQERLDGQGRGDMDNEEQ